mmetsp:Transcript_7889/g.26068  ORF Transcript_7889/g.26068 Transcript_7889/m.26068 type:complete len:256 (-) Transcript_7889:609-1376(-)
MPASRSHFFPFTTFERLTLNVASPILRIDPTIVRSSILTLTSPQLILFNALLLITLSSASSLSSSKAGKSNSCLDPHSILFDHGLVAVRAFRPRYEIDAYGYPKLMFLFTRFVHFMTLTTSIPFEFSSCAFFAIFIYVCSTSTYIRLGSTKSFCIALWMNEMTQSCKPGISETGRPMGETETSTVGVSLKDTSTPETPGSLDTRRIPMMSLPWMDKLVMWTGTFRLFKYIPGFICACILACDAFVSQPKSHSNCT